ncbi:THUMP domain-containing protein 2 [Sander lucioperca]|uniref:THUMP domain containing 2 n=1 Tax=Sander lucioperca TaxID=283035 RepID=A0A8C9YDC8_SANLU|nr:THUMP domain-containing protein 2 [Sander lucioperca]XP_031171966.1 THUMP domain-containing protein 2 [Sander lucioperca]
MTDARSEASLVRYYCTAGNGMEHFLIDEVKRKLAAEDVCQMPGKVLFSSSVGINRVSELKAAERLFLLLKQDLPVQLSANTNPAKAASVLQSRVLGDKNHWTSAVMTWSHLQGELEGRRTTVNPSSTALGVTMKKEEGSRIEEQRGKEEEEKCDEEKKSKRETAQRGEMSSGETCGAEAQILEKKRKRDSEEKESNSDKKAEKQRTSEKERKGQYKEDDEEGRSRVMEFNSCGQNEKRAMISDTDLYSRGSVCVNATPEQDHNLERSCMKMDDMAKDFAVKNVGHVKTTGGRGIKPEPSSPDPVSFRISCKCTGSLSRYFNTQEVSRVIGVGLSKLLGWKTDLKNPQLEVNVNLSDDHCLLGIPLTRLPLAHRSYIKTTGLRSTVAWAMASLAQIQPGFCVVDPMCGVGTILIEAAQEHKASHFLGMDIDDGQLLKAKENVEFAVLGNRIHLLKASSMMLPLPSASVDAVVCDLPFGRKFGTKTTMAANLPLILTEMERIICIGGTLVLLLSPQLSCLLKKLLAQTDSGPTSNQETKPQTGIQDCPSLSPSCSKQQTFQIVQGVNSPPTQKTDPWSVLQHSLPPPLSSLKHQATLRVSLGAIDGLIHKYVKTET